MMGHDTEFRSAILSKISVQDASVTPYLSMENSQTLSFFVICLPIPRVVKNTTSAPPPPKKNNTLGNTCYLEGSKIFNFMDTDGCTNCELCPGGSVIFPNATVDYFWGPGYFYDLQCYQIEYALKTGFFFTAENCTYIQTGLAGVCCGVGPATLAPAFAMPDDPASAPPGSTSAGSDPIGTTMTRTTSMVLMSGIAAAAASVVW